jgi:hypothetical protein
MGFLEGSGVPVLYVRTHGSYLKTTAADSPQLVFIYYMALILVVQCKEQKT